MRHIALLLVGVLLLAANGCGGSFEKLSGKVIFEDGKPLDQGTVCFLKDGYLARGTIQPDGSYTVGSLEESDGLPPGTYQVYIEGAIVEDPKSPTGVSAVIDEKWTKPTTSNLTHDVPNGGSTLDITVGYPK